MVNNQLEEEGIHMMTNTIIKSVKKLGERQYQVEMETSVFGGGVKHETLEVNTILMAIGRDPNPESFRADLAGLALNKSSRKLIGRAEEIERTNVDHIYGVGDIVHGVPELMPVA